MNGSAAAAGWRGLLAVGWILAALGAPAHTPLPASPSSSGRTFAHGQSGAIFVARRGWHIDVGFAVDELAQPLRSVAYRFPGARYLFFGFGDRRYLTAAHRGAPVLARALWPGPGLLLVTALRAEPAAAFGAAHVITLSVSSEGSLRGQAFVWQTLSNAEQFALLNDPEAGAAAAGMPGPYAGSLLFESRDSYSAAHTCNTWAAQALGSTGAPVTSHGLVFAGQLWNQLKSDGLASATSPAHR